MFIHTSLSNHCKEMTLNSIPCSILYNMILNASYYLLHTNKLCFCVQARERAREREEIAREREEIGWKEDSLPQKPYLTLTVPPPPPPPGSMLSITILHVIMQYHVCTVLTHIIIIMEDHFM